MIRCYTLIIPKQNSCKYQLFKAMRRKTIYLVGLWICISPAFSCKNGHQQAKAVVVKMPGRIEEYNPYIRNADSPRLMQNERKPALLIYTLIDVSCSTCILKLDKWSDFISEIKSDRRNLLSIKPVCFSEDHFETLKFLFENNRIEKFAYPLLLDLENKFMSENPTLVSRRGEMTVLTDTANKVLLAGNPLENKEDRDLFIKKINETAD